MELVDGRFHLSASDLSNHTGCRHLTNQSLRVARGELKAPLYNDPRLDALRERGAAHELAYIEHLEEANGWQRHTVQTQTVEETRALMTAGVDLIVQAPLSCGPWRGRADVLIKVPTASKLGAWSYEVIDTKLARETKAATILQLCLYTELVAEIQGAMPARLGVVTPLSMQPEWYRTLDYVAYFRRVKASLIVAVGEPSDTYPEPVELCDVCRWQSACRNTRRHDDHLSLVAGITKSQRRELVGRNVATVAALAQLPVPLQFRPDRGAAESYQRVREQARVQVAGRDRKVPYHELLLPVQPERGLCRLQEPIDGDLYFDIEGDRYVGRDGIEYLLGVAYRDRGVWHYRAFWGLNAADEKAAFEAFVAFVEEQRTRYPTLHIYHFGHYEPSAIKRLMGRYATRETEVDNWLRRRVFVDLHQVVRESLIASVERYGLKELEPFYAFPRSVALDVAGLARAHLERAIELGQLATLKNDVRPNVEGYNRDDCMSTGLLHQWLEALRAERIRSGGEIPRVVRAEPDVKEELLSRLARVQVLVESLTHDVPADEQQRTAAEHARWLLAHSLDYYRREAKVEWWAKYRMVELDPAEYLYESKALGGLEFVETVDATKQGIPTHRYRFPAQNCEIRRDDKLRTSDDDALGTVVDLDLNHCMIDIKKTKKMAAIHPHAVFEFNHIGTDVLEDALIRLAEWVLNNDIEAPGEFRASRDLLLRHAPRLRDGTLSVDAQSLTTDAQRICRHLDESILPVQGPPGSGKTYLGAELIVDLARNGRKVGVTANSHKVIRNLLDAVIKSAHRQGVAIRCAAKPDEKGDLDDTGIVEVNDNDGALTAIQVDCDVLGATKFLWSRQDFARSVDVLIVDEASQFALADALAISGAAKSVVYLGDPMQLERPQEGTHPDGVDVSPLDHLLDGEATMPAAQGIFMPETRRLHPSICEYTSEVFYDGKLHSMKGLEQQRLIDCGEFDGAGLHLVPVPHEGNQSSSKEETKAIERILTKLAKGRWVNEHGEVTPLTQEDVLIVTPYNAQVALLSESFPGARVGTVDKFQGQEAPVVIYSMATSSAEEAPRGMEFLYSLNRLNVATSRARCAVILVASPRMFEVECKTPRQMQLANALCRFAEVASRTGRARMNSQRT